MNVLVVGSGGREHALAWAISRSPLVRKVAVAPGNAGTARIATNLPVAATDIAGQVRAARDWGADFVVIGPDASIAAGLADALAVEGILAFGPTQAAGRIEASKAFAKELMVESGVPTARYAAFNDAAAAHRYLDDLGVPAVVKADGLADGKGVVVADTLAQSHEAVDNAMAKRTFGDAGASIVIEERLYGPEVSLMTLVDGTRVVPLPTSCDYKRVGDGDEGPNTGGMGVYSPPAWFGPEAAAAAARTHVQPVVDALAARGTPFRGCIYAGLMVTEEGPKVIEYNARFGDPETQVVFPCLDADVAELLLATARGDLSSVSLPATTRAGVGVVLASANYPGPVEKGKAILGLNSLPEDILVFHANTAAAGDDFTTNGGRVLNVVATAATLAEARERVYKAIPTISFDGMHYRRDIALREIQ